MPTGSYHTLAGRIAPTTIGTNRQECLPDALGSVVTTTIAGAATGKQIRYANHGGVIYDVGEFNRPRNAWVGSFGYRSTQVLDRGGQCPSGGTGFATASKGVSVRTDECLAYNAELVCLGKTKDKDFINNYHNSTDQGRRLGRYDRVIFDGCVLL